jgi:hypothetical protein
MTDTPALRYYRALVGAWQGRFSFELTDRVALRAEPVAVRLRVAGYALAQRLAGPDWMSTTLAPAPEDGAGAFLHTTRVRRLGVTLFSGGERFALRDDGRSFAVAGTQRSWPTLGAGERYSGDGEIDAAASGATYRLRWLGAPLLQRTAIVPEGLLLTQETRWSRAQVLLVRQQ